MNNFIKDVLPHFIEGGKTAQIQQDAADAFVVSELKSGMVTGAMQALDAPLPTHVQRFTAEIEKTFERTATNLDIVATRLEGAAKELRKRAADLRDASPQVQLSLETWIKFERDSSERSKFLNTLFHKETINK